MVDFAATVKLGWPGIIKSESMLACGSLVTAIPLSRLHCHVGLYKAYLLKRNCYKFINRLII